MNMEGFRVDPRVTTPEAQGHFGTKDGQFGMKVDKLAEIWDLARLLPLLR